MMLNINTLNPHPNQGDTPTYPIGAGANDPNLSYEDELRPHQIMSPNPNTQKGLPIEAPSAPISHRRHDERIFIIQPDGRLHPNSAGNVQRFPNFPDITTISHYSVNAGRILWDSHYPIHLPTTDPSSFVLMLRSAGDSPEVLIIHDALHRTDPLTTPDQVERNPCGTFTSSQRARKHSR